MATPPRALANDRTKCKVVRLDSRDPKSPLVVMQEGCAPNDPAYRMRMFYLQHDGCWIDEVARSTRPDSEAGDVVFETMAEVLTLLAALFGKPRVREVPVTQSDVDAYVARVKGGSPEELFRQFLTRYRSAKAKA